MNQLLRQVKTKVTLSGLELPIRSITLNHTIGMLPGALVRVALDDQDSNLNRGVPVDLARVTNLTRLLQDKLLNKFSLDPDLRIHVEDGDQGTLDFVGFMGKPSVTLVSGDLDIGITGVHRGAALHSYNPSIYRSETYYLRIQPGTVPYRNETAAVVAAAPEYEMDLARFAERSENSQRIRVSNSIAERAHLLLHDMVKSYDSLKDVKDWHFRAAPVHRLNGFAWPDVTRFFMRSYSGTRILGINDPLFNPYTIHETILGTLTSAGSLLEGMLQLAPEFMFQMNADWDDNIRMERVDRHETPDGRLIRVPVGSFSFDLATQFQPPILQVLVQGRGDKSYLQPGAGANFGGQLVASGFVSAGGDGVPPNSEISLSGKIDSIINTAFGLTHNMGQPAISGDVSMLNSLCSLARYPEVVPKNSAGTYVVIQAPDWLYADQNGRDNQATFLTFKPKSAEVMGKPAQHLIDTIDEANDQKRREVMGDLVSVNILNYLAEQKFKELYLGSTTASLSIPLNVNVKVGMTYRVEDTNRQHIFDAFLDTVQHTIQVSPDGSTGDAVTRLGFSHVKAPELKLNPLVYDPSKIKGQLPQNNSPSDDGTDKKMKETLDAIVC